MAGQESSNNNKYEALIPKFQYKRPDAQREMFPNTDDLFKPRVVSLGPVYHTEKNWQVTKDDKSKIKEVLDRKKGGDFDSDEMKIALVVARSLYHEEKLDDNFDEMMILDACFIIHAIDYITKGESEVLDKRPHLLPLILEDMFLLENQIPIIVLEAAMNVLGRKYPEDINEFIKKITRSPNGARTLCDYVMELPCPIQFLVFLLVCLIAPAMLLFLLVVVLPLALLILLVVCLPLGLVCLLCQKRCTEPQGGVGTEKQRDLEQPTKQEGSKEECVEQASGQEPSHLLHLLRAHLLSCSEENQHAAATHDNTWLPPRRATELTDAGIKFERSPTSSLKDVTFKKGIIYGYIYLPSLAQLTKTRFASIFLEDRRGDYLC